jgi:hypothetical protein
VHKNKKNFELSDSLPTDLRREINSHVQVYQQNIHIQLHSYEGVFETSLSTVDLQTLTDTSDVIIKQRKNFLQAPEF